MWNIPEYNYSNCIEIGQISAILADHFLENLSKISNKPYVDDADIIGNWAVDFFDKHRETNWEDVLENPESYDLPKEVICWDDAIVHFGHGKFAEFLKQS